MTKARPVRMAVPAFPAPAPVVKTSRKIVRGVALEDDFAWLRAENWQEVLRDPARLPQDIRDVLEAENIYADAVLAPLQKLKKQLLKEMRGRIKEEDSDPPQPDGAYDYYTRTRENGQHEVICRRPRGGGPETVLLDGDALAKGKPFFSLAGAAHSPDHALLAWSADDKGSELHDIRIRRIAEGADLAGSIAGSDGTVIWNAASDAIYYVAMDENHRPARVMRHRVGTATAQDALIFEETDPGLFVHLRRLQARRFAVISIHDHDSSECRLIDLHDAHAAPTMIEPRRAGVRYDAEHRGDLLYLRTNADGAKDFKIVTAPVATPAKAQWTDLVQHVAGCMIATGTVFADFIVRLEREHGLPRIVITQASTGQTHVIAFDEQAYSLGIETGFEFDTPLLRFVYSSMTTPDETYEYDMATRRRTLLKRQEIPSGHNRADYVTRRIFAQARDGAQVPVTLLYRADRPAGVASPLLLYGYGAYGYALPASFGAARLSLVDRGFVYAVAHVRGGTDKGWGWYEDGKLEHKSNTFHDFLAAARHLIADGTTQAGKIVAHGGSAGGMLMGAVANMAPELFAGIVADVPFVDVLNTMLDDTLPLTPPEWLEWGNPIESKQAFDAIRGYSPYDNVTAQHYPAMFVQAGLADPRVTYWEPAKWVAKLRATMTGGGPGVLKTIMDAGHGGASGRFDQLEETALHYAFAIAAAG